MRPVNLIPPEDRRGERAPLRAGPIAYALVGALVLAFVGVYVMVSTSNSITDSESQVAALEQDLEASQARVTALQSFTSLQSLEEQRTQTITSLARSRFDWERVIRELAYVIPADVSLENLSGAVGAAAESESSEVTTDITSPNLQMTGCGPTHESVARMVAALRDIDGVTRVGLESSIDQAKADEETAPTSEESLGCSKTSFEISVAFDEVIVDGSGAIAPPADDGSGTGEVAAERKAGKDAVDEAAGEANQAVDNYVPGT